MSYGNTETTQRICERFRKTIATGESQADAVMDLSLIYGVGRPAIRRRLQAGGVFPAPRAERPEPKRIIRRRAKRQSAGAARMDSLPPRVDRDPCPRCGVRGDIPCGHSKTRLGTSL